MKKKILLGLLAILVIIQFFRPAENVSGEKTNDISTKYAVPSNVKLILDKACADCHSNKTVYPWYANLQPVAWWLGSHVNDGKRHLNFNNFTHMKIAVQNKKMQECIEQVKQGEMPLSSYTLIHTNATLTDAEKQTLYNWCNSIIDTIKANYPADSLILQKRKWD